MREYVNEAMYASAYSGSMEALQFLVIRLGADVDHVHLNLFDNRTALMAAAITGREDVYRFLLKRGADEDKLAPFNPSAPLEYAVCCNMEGLVEWRLSYEADHASVASGIRLAEKMTK